MKNKQSAMQRVEKAAGIWSSVSNPGVGAGYLAGNASDWNLISLYVNNSIVHSAVEMNAEAVASTPWQLMRAQKNSDPVPLLNHEILDLFHNSDEMLDSHQIIRLISVYLQTVGRAYILIERDPISNLPTSLKILQPWWVEPYRQADGTILNYFYMNLLQNQGRSEKVAIAVENMVDIRNAAPSDPYGGGDSALRSAYPLGKLAASFIDYQGQLFSNRARPDAVFIPGGDVSEDESLILTKQFNDKFRGTGNGKILIANKAGKFQPLSYQPTDLAPLKINKQLQESILNALHIPLPLMEAQVNRAGIQGAILQWQTQAIRPLVHLIEGKINRKIVRPFGSDLKIIFNNPVDEDKEFIALQATAENEKMLNAFKAGAISVNEYRTTLGLPPVVEGDDFIIPPATTPEVLPDTSPEPTPTPPAPKTFHRFFLDLNEKVSSGAIERGVAIALAAKVTGDSEFDVKTLIGHRQEQKPSSNPSEGLETQPGAANEAGNGLKAATIGVPADESPKTGVPVPDGHELIPIVSQAFHRLHSMILDQIEKKGLSESITKFFNKAEDSELPDNFTPISEWSKELSEKCQPVCELIAHQGWKYVQSRVGASADVFSVCPPKIAEAIKKSSMKMADSTMDTTLFEINTAKEELRKQIFDGVFTGDAVAELKDRVKSIFTNLESKHAELIARTEASRAIHNGVSIAAEASGKVSGFQFLTSSECCAECAALDGNQIPVGGQFRKSDYDDSMLPVHPGCRCTVTEILK